MNRCTHYCDSCPDCNCNEIQDDRNPWMQGLIDFHKEVVPTGNKSLRMNLITEEYNELVRAISREDLVEIVDGACDLIYVVLGTMVHYGIDLTPYFAEVHRTNMEKATGEIRSDGKKLKPEGWSPPRIKEMLEEGVGRL